MLVRIPAGSENLEKINSVHTQYRSERWQHLHHYILPFHDCTFECVADGYETTADVSAAPLLRSWCAQHDSSLGWLLSQVPKAGPGAPGVNIPGPQKRSLTKQKIQPSRSTRGW